MARRVNSKFLVFLVSLTGAVLVVGVSAIYFHSSRHSVDYRQLEARADEDLRNGEILKAASLLKDARDQVPDNTEILVKLGDALNQLTGTDPIYLGQARIQWNKAVSVDPHCAPALRSLLKSYSDELDMNARPEVFVELKRVCNLLLNVEPGDLSAQEKKQVAVVHEWYSSQTTSNDEVRQSIAVLPELIRKDPDNAELPRTLALAKIQQARTMLDVNENLNALQELDDATKMLDAARKGRDQNADMQYRAFQSYLKIKQIYPDIKNNKAKQKEYDDRIANCINLALNDASKMDPDKDTLCDDIYQAASEWASQQDKPDEAESIMRGFYDKHQNDQRARLTLARVLEIKADTRQDPKSRDEAVGILKMPVVEAPKLAGFAALVSRDLKAQTVAELIRIYLANFSSTPETDKDKRKVVAGQIDDQLAELRHLYPPQSVPVLNLEGRFHLLKGENVEAVKTFEQAVLQMSANNMDNDLLYQLAIAYTRTGQPGRARQRLEQVIIKLDGAVPARILLTRVLMQLGDVEGAAVQLKRLLELAPDSPEVKQLASSLAIVDPKDKGKSESAYRQLPEQTREERLAKSQVAIITHRNDEAARILEAFLKNAPENALRLEQLSADAKIDEKKDATHKVEQDVQASVALAQVYAGSLGQKETAKRVAADALKLHPDDPTLVDLDARLHDMLPEDIYAAVSKAVQKMTDPFARAITMYNLDARPGGHPEKAFGDLLEANKIKPDDAHVLDLMFAHYLKALEFDKAKLVGAKLSAQNADQCGGLMYQYRLSLAQGDLATAENQGRELTQKYPEFAASWLVTAQVLQLRGKFDEAVHDYLEVLNRQPGQYDSYRGLIECYFRLNQPDAAEIRLREARTHYPSDRLLREQLLAYLVNYGKAAQAIPDREKILADDKQQQKDVPDDYLQLARAYFRAAQDEAPTNHVGEAEHLQKAFDTLGQGKEKFPDEGRFASQLAELYQYSGNVEAGEKVLKELYDRPNLKDDPQPALLTSEFYSRGNQFAKAESYLNDAMVKAEKKEGHPDIEMRLRLASLQAQQGRFDQAYDTLKGVGSADSTDPRIVRQRLEIMIAQGHRDEARKDIDAELARQDRPDLRLLRASLLIDDRDIDGAMKDLDHTLALDPKNDAALYLQTLAMAKKGLVDQAVSQLVGLRKRDPRNAQVRLLLAELYSKSGKYDYAIRELAEALPKMTVNRQVRLELIQLYRSLRPLTNDTLREVIRLCTAAEADPVLKSDPTWAREEALAYASMTPPDVPRAVAKWHEVITLVPAKPEYRREFVDQLIQFHDWNAVLNETSKLTKDGHNEWWLHYQRGMATAHLGQKEPAVAEFEEALKVTDLKAAESQGQFIIRGLGENCGHDLALNHIMPLLESDPDGSWHLMEALEREAQGQFPQAEDIVTQMLADPRSKAPDHRVPLLRTKADICQAHADADAKDPAKSLADTLRARDAYLELLQLVPDDSISLNNLAYLLSERIPPPQGGPLKAKTYSTKAYDLIRFSHTPNIMVMDTQGWVLTLCGGADAIEGFNILHSMIVDRDDTKTFVEGRYHLAEAYLRSAKPDLASAQKWLREAMALIANDEREGRPIDTVLKDKIQTALARATGPVTSGQ